MCVHVCTYDYQCTVDNAQSMYKVFAHKLVVCTAHTHIKHTKRTAHPQIREHVNNTHKHTHTHTQAHTNPRKEISWEYRSTKKKWARGHGHRRAPPLSARSPPGALLFYFGHFAFYCRHRIGLPGNVGTC